MTRCNDCSGMYSHRSHYAICINTFGKCVDCMIKDNEFNESHLKQIQFLAGDDIPTENKH